MAEPGERAAAAVAIVGLAGRFPGAADAEQLWRNLRQGVEAITFFSDEELRAAGADPALLADPRLVKAAPVLDGIELFDAPFFSLTAREAEILDPQQRLLLEHAWAALESAGYDPGRYRGTIGLFAGCGMNAYLWHNLARRPEVLRAHGFLQVLLGNEKDYLATRAAYALNLRGPAVNVQTACSTALVAVHLASQALLDYHCDMALAAAVRVAVPQIQGYIHEEGGINSPDGHCRPFDAGAAGTLFGSGVGVVVLKRLEDAQRDGDTIRAVVRGTAVNNDGSQKVGFTAPGIDGQSGVIAEALAAAGVDPASISYVEAHGTATPLGDPIEVQALTRAFQARTGRRGFCALGSVKGNLGHLDTAAGMAGLIKTVLALEHREIPPSLHFAAPNPQIDFAASPFYVNDRLRPWEAEGPRRAGVSSFGIGGTNAHVILEEAPAAPPPAPARPSQLLVWSARTPGAVERATDALAACLRARQAAVEGPGAALADVAFTLQAGRRRFAHRRAVVCSSAGEAAGILERRDRSRLLAQAAEAPGDPAAAVFLFPGQGAQHPGMGRGLYAGEEVFRREVDRAAEVLRPLLGLDLREVLLPEAGADPGAAAARLRRTDLAQAALFTVEHALARLWMSWGVRPQALAGHSIGEVTAACVAGVFSPEDALALVAARGRAMRDRPAGAMLGVPLPEAEVRALLDTDFRDLDLAAVNAPDLCAVAGPPPEVERLHAALAGRGVTASRLHTSHAFHGRGMDPAAAAVAAEAARLSLNPPAIPFVSNLTGTWIRAEEATDPGYWGRQLRQTVRFAAGLAEVLREPSRVLLEVGPGRTLAGLARRHPALGPRHAVVSSLPAARDERDEEDDVPALLAAAARLWLAGVGFSWKGLHGGPRRRVPLPTYPFERLRYWIDPPAAASEGLPAAAPVTASAAVVADTATIAAAADIADTADVAAAPAPRASHRRPNLATAYAAPRDERERALAALWEEKLGVEPVGVADDFFELGGHSLTATQVAAAVRATFGTDATLRQLFATPTVAGMAAVLARVRTGLAPPALPVLTPDPGQAHEPFPLTDVQAAYWLGRGGAFALGGVGTHSYFEMEAAGIDLERFARALRLLIDRHGMLRAVVEPDGLQRVLPEVPPYELAVLDLRGAEADAAAAQLLAVRERMSHQVLPADRWPLFEIRATVLPDGRVRFHVSFDFLIGDAWSVHLLGDDLVRLYHDPAALPPPPAVAFRDYVLAEAALRESDLFARSREYWQARLDTLPPAPELPLAVDPEALGQVRFTRRRGGLDAPAWERFKAAASGAGLTLSAAVLAAFAEVLAAWSRSPRFTLNLTLFNRLPLHPEVNAIVGDFTSLTLLEVDAAAGATFADRARLVQQRLWDDLDHRAMGGVRVLRELARTRGAAAAVAPVVFTSLLTLRPAPAAAAAPAAAPGGEEDLALAGVYGVSQTPQVWLDHQAAERGGRLDLNWDAVDELFPVGLLDDMMAAYLGLLRRLADGEATWRERAPLRLPAAHLALHAAAGAAASGAPPGGLLHQPFLARAAAAPAAPAVIGAGRTLSYGELLRLAQGLGRRLRARGVAPGSHVAVVMRKGWEQVAAVLGIHVAGAAYLPVGAELPRERRDALLRLGEVRVVLTQPRWAQEGWPPDVEVLTVAYEEVAGEADEAGHEPAEAAVLAYTIFTSGSTGVPKGVMIDHRGALNTVADVNGRFRVGPRDRVLALSSLSFDLSVWDVFGLLAAGGAIVLPEPEADRDPERWLELMERERVSLWNTVPALLEMLVEHAEGRGVRLPAALRLVLLSGDWLPVGLPDRVRALAAGPVEIVSLGGATEASIWSILYPIGEVDPSWRSIPYGRAMAHQSFHVLDRQLEPRPPWVAGDLYIGGVGLAQGYWRDPAKTAASFVPDPRTGGRLYRTGDLGRLRPDGQIEILGREDFQVKIQGHRIELGEIEATLCRHPAVRAAVAAAVGERGRGRRLAAWVVPEEGRAPVAAELAAWLAASLPAHMVPAAFVLLDALPLTANGKLDRRALPAPEAAPAAGAAGPRTPLEELVAGIWEEVLGTAGLGPGDDFYAAGGDSLLATRVVSRIRERLGSEISLRDFFAAPTVAGVALAAEAGRGAWAARAAPLAPSPRDGDLPLSFAQERLWFLAQLAPQDPAYNEVFTLRVAGPLAPAVLARALAEEVRRHEILRTTFGAREGQPVQRVRPAGPVALPLADLSRLPPAGRLGAGRRLASGLARRPFDLGRGPLLRVHLLRLDEAEHLLVLVLHHIVCDAWSMAILARELTALYAAFRAGLPSPLPPLAVQYADFARWQREWLRGETLAGQLAWWRSQLAGLPAVFELPADRPRPPVASYRGASLPLRVPAQGLEPLRPLCRASGTTLFMALLAAFQALLHRSTGQPDVVVGSPVANRGRVELEGLVGFFTNTLVLRTDLGGDPSYRQLLGRVQQVALGAYAHQDVPFERLVEELRPERTLSHAPLFQVMLALQNAPRSPQAPPPAPAELTLSLFDLDAGTAKFDLTLNLMEGAEGGLRGLVEFSSDLFDRHRIARLAGHFRTLLEAAAAAPDQPLSDLPLLAAAERHQLALEWNDTAAAGAARCIHQPVEEQAARTPDAVAVASSAASAANVANVASAASVASIATAAGEAPGGPAAAGVDPWTSAAVAGGAAAGAAAAGAALSYAELERRSNRLAHHLLALDAGPGERVAICLERSLDMTVAVLAVLKAGAAYLPIDPVYPAERIAYLLADARPCLLITHSALAARLPAADPDGPADPVDPNVGVRRLLLDRERAAVARRPGDRPRRRARPEDLAYVIYTSGSTGRPKGVAMPHAVLANLFAWQCATSACGPGASTLQFASLSFDASCQEMFATWWSGGRLVLVPPAARQDPRALCRVLREDGVARMVLPFVALQQLAEALAEGEPAPAALAEVLTAGEQLQVTPQLAAWLGGGAGTYLENQYGPTEGHVVTAWRLTGPPSSWAALPPIGRPLANVRIHLLDAAFRPVPVGIAGQLFIGGAQVVRGYLGRPGLTAERFVPDPLAALHGEAGARLYATGDRACHLPDGRIQFLGRLDQQVKIRGFRVEPGEIETALAAHPEVRACAVAARAQPAGGLRLVAWVVAAGAAAPAAAELRAFLLQRLPEPLVPAVFQTLDALPLNNSGKVDRRALPDPEPAALAADLPWVAPRTPTEEVVAELWSGLLGVTRIGPADHFFALGGHSLLATRLAARVRRVFRVELPLGRIFARPTLEAMAGEIASLRGSALVADEIARLYLSLDGRSFDGLSLDGLSLDGAAAGPADLPEAERLEAGRLARFADLLRARGLDLPCGLEISRHAAGGPAPLSLTQERLWFQEQMEPGAAANNLMLAVALGGPLDPAALRRGLDELVRRHETLRTSFRTVQGVPLQVVAPPRPVPLGWVDLGGLPDGAAEVRRLAAAWERRPFDLGAGPLLRLAVARLGEDDQVLVLTIHHLVADGWSLGIFVRELAALYRAFRAGRPSPLPELPVQYRDFARWQREQLQGEVLAAHLAWWRGRLAGAPPLLRLPVDRPRPALPSTRGATLSWRLDAAATGALLGLCRGEGATLFMGLLTAFTALLRAVCGQDDVVVGTDIANRGRRETEGLIGFFVNALALRTDLGGDPSWRELLGRVRETTLGAYSHQNLPFSQLVEALRPERGGGHHPFFQVVLILHNFALQREESSGLRFTPFPVHGGSAKFDLSLYLVERDDGIEGLFEYNTDLFDRRTAARLLEQLGTVVEAMTADPGRRLSALSLGGSEQVRGVLDDFNEDLEPLLIDGAGSGAGGLG